MMATNRYIKKYETYSKIGKKITKKMYIFFGTFANSG